MLGHVGGDEGELHAHVFAAHCAKKAEALRSTSTSSFRRLLSWRSRTSSPASACCRSIAEAEPAASNSSRHVFSCVGVTPSSAATLACVAPGADSRATACSLYSGETRRLVCLVIPSLQIGRYFTRRSAIREQQQSLYASRHNILISPLHSQEGSPPFTRPRSAISDSTQPKTPS